MKKAVLLLLGLSLLDGGFFAQQQRLRPAQENVFQIDKDAGEIRLNHFVFSFLPRFENGFLYDLFFGIKYQELGTDFSVDWVPSYAGHLINLEGVSSRWFGYFPGMRSIKYSFFLELKEDPQSPSGVSLLIRIFSSNPELDAKYISNLGKPPFTVVGRYLSFETIRTAIEIYEWVSTIKAVYGIATASNPATLIATAIGENIVLMVLKSGLNDKLKEVEITCNVCGRKAVVPVEGNRDIKFTCPTVGCGNQGIIVIAK